jgi:hypothetical protein
VHAIDIESDASNQPVQNLVLVAIAGPSGAALYHQADPKTPRVIQAVVEAGEVAFANAPGDVMMMIKRWPELLPIFLAAYERSGIVDVLTSDKLGVIATGAFEMRFGLAAVVERRCGIVLAKGEDTYRLRYGEFMHTPIRDLPPEAAEYALNDGIYTRAARLAQLEHFGEEILVPAPAIARKHFALYRQQLPGLALDPAAVERLDARLAEEIEHYTRECIKHGLARPKTKKPGAHIQNNQKVARAMLEELGVPLVRTDPTTKFPDGQISLAEDALKAAKIPPGHPLDSFRRRGARMSLRTKFITPRRGPVIYTKYDELKRTSRTGSAGYDDKDWRGPISDNLQNQPKEKGFRECHVPRPGRRYAISDWKGAELVTLAQVQLDWFGRSRLAEVLREGRNPHEEMACTILGIDRSRYDKENPEHKETRQLAKIPNFGLPGGLGPKRLCEFALKEPYNRIITLDQAKRLKAQWLETWPEMSLYFAAIDSMDAEDGSGIRIKGPRFGVIRGGAIYTEACNFPFQGLAAAAAGEALWRLLCAEFDSTSPLFDCYQVLFVHDEIVTEVHEATAREALAEQDRIMIEAFRVWCPDIPIETDSIVSDRYRKP